MEEPAGFEPANQGVADPRLTTWLRFHDSQIDYTKLYVRFQLKLLLLQDKRMKFESCVFLSNLVISTVFNNLNTLLFLFQNLPILTI